MPRFRASLTSQERVRYTQSLNNSTSDEYDDTTSDLCRWGEDAQIEQERMLNLWEDWCADSQKDDNYTLREGWEAPPLAELKAFVRYMVSASGHDLEKPSARGIGIRISKFWSGVLRRTKYVAAEEMKAEIQDFIKHKLRREGKVTTHTKGKLAFKRQDQEHSMLVLWTELDPQGQRRPGRMRIILTAALHLFCYTGARIGAIIPLDKDTAARNSRRESKIRRTIRPGSNFQSRIDLDDDELKGIRWKDLTFTLLPRASRRPELTFTLSQAWIKKNLDPNNGLKTAHTLRDNVLIDPMPWLLALAFADRAFQEYETVEELWQQRIPANRKTFEIQWKEEKQDLHVFRPSVHSSSALTQKTFNHWFTKWMRQAGYTRPVNIQRIREEVTNVIDRAGVTPAARKHTVGHTQSVFNQSYIHSLSSVDVQALYLGEEQRSDHIEQLTSLSTALVRGFPYRLPDEVRDRVCAADETFQALRKQLSLLRNNGAETKSVKNELNTQRHRLKSKALKEYQQQWLKDQYRESAKNKGEDKPESGVSESRFAHLLLFKPDHLRVVATINGRVDYSDDTRPSFISTLVRLANEEEVTLHRPHETPIQGYCPVVSCRARLTTSIDDQHLHVHACRKKEADGQYNDSVTYCFRCFKFFRLGREWQQHCKEHLSDLPMDCGVITQYPKWRKRYCIQHGFCLFCAQRGRYQVFERSDLLCAHFIEHIQSQVDWPAACPHPRCPLTSANADQMVIHLEGAHGLDGLSKALSSTLGKAGQKKRRRSPGVDTQSKRRVGASTYVPLPKYDIAITQLNMSDDSDSAKEEHYDSADEIFFISDEANESDPFDCDFPASPLQDPECQAKVSFSSPLNDNIQADALLDPSLFVDLTNEEP